MEITLDYVKQRNIKLLTDCIEENKNVDLARYNRFCCLVKECERDFKDKSNAIRHLRMNHIEIYESIQSNKKAKSQESDHMDGSFLELRVRVNVHEIWAACVDLITKNALPICFVEFPAFKKILEPYVTALKKQGIILNLNRDNIKSYIDKRANEILQRIRGETKGKLVNLMTDIASRHNRSVLGINIKYDVNGKKVVRTIGMHTLRFASTAVNLRDLITNTLAETTGLTLENIFSVTTDNGANLLKAVALLDEDYQKEYNVPSASLCENEYESNSDEDIDPEIFDDDYYTDLLNNIRSEFNSLAYSNLIMGLSCAAHCLHLVVMKAIGKSETMKLLLYKVRELVKKLRTPTFRNHITGRGLNQPIIDVVTRWNTIYLMVMLIYFFPFDFEILFHHI